MIHVLTVHQRDPRWIRPQSEYLRRHLSEPCRVVASCEGISIIYHHGAGFWRRFEPEDVPG